MNHWQPLHICSLGTMSEICIRDVHFANPVTVCLNSEMFEVYSCSEGDC